MGRWPAGPEGLAGFISNVSAHEIHRLFCQRQPLLLRGGGQYQPFAHRFAFPGVEVFAITGFDKRLDPFARSLTTSSPLTSMAKMRPPIFS
jgi:hypothetical protein